MSTIAIYVPEDREIDLAALSVADYELVRGLHGLIRRGDGTLLCKRSRGDREMHVFKLGENYFARHFGGGGHGQHRISRISDEHLRGTETWLKAWDLAGIQTGTEVTTDNRVRLDAVAFGSQVTALETQVSPQSARVVKGRHTQRTHARSLTGQHQRALANPLRVVWFAPVGRPDWLYQVPTIQCANRSWESTPDPREVAAVGVRSVDVKPCSATWFSRCPERQFGWCSKQHLWMEPRKGLSVADVAAMVPSNDLAEVKMPGGIYLVDRASYARCKNFGYQSPQPSVSVPSARQPTSCDFAGHQNAAQINPSPLVADPYHLGSWARCVKCKKRYRPVSEFRRCYDCARAIGLR